MINHHEISKQKQKKKKKAKHHFHFCYYALRMPFAKLCCCKVSYQLEQKENKSQKN
jgi:hypothetical protein